MSQAALPPSRWVVVPAPNPSARLRLFCFPYAGGGASVFYSWPRFLPAEVEVCAVQLPGGEGRIGETPISDPSAIIDQLDRALAPRLDRPFAFFGHSMGATLAFELTRRLRAGGRREPIHLVLSGRAAPQCPPDCPPIHALPDAEFVHELRELGGTPEEVLQNVELLDIILPRVRADFTLSETFVHREEAALAIPISAYGGASDTRVPEASIDGWRAHTTGAFRKIMFPAGHFFLNELRPQVLAELSLELSRTLPGSGRPAAAAARR